MSCKSKIIMISLGLLVSHKLIGTTAETFPGQKVALSYSDCSDGHAKIIDVSPHTASNIGWKVPIKMTFEADEDITDGSFSLDTNWPDVAGGNETPMSPWKMKFLNCSGDASLGMECKFANSYEDYKAKHCTSNSSVSTMPEWSCRLAYKLANMAGGIKVDGLRFPVAAGSFDVNMELGFTYPFGIGDVSLKQGEAKVTSLSETGEKVFCVKVWQGAKQKDGMRPLTYQDCGDSQTHGKVVGLQPLSVRDGEKVRVHAKVVVGTAVSASSGTMHVESYMTVGDLASCSGDASLPKSCPLHAMWDIKLLPMWWIPIGTIKYRGVQFPIKKGAASVLVDLWLDPLIPSEMVCTTTRFMASTKSGKNFVCVDVHTNADSTFCQGLNATSHSVPHPAKHAPLFVV